MKVELFSVIASSALALTSWGGGDVHDDALLWLRGDSDANGNGFIDSGEAVDARNGSSEGIELRGWLADVSGGTAQPAGDFVWTNDAVVVPFTGRSVPGAKNYFFRQSERMSDGAFWPNGIRLPDMSKRISSDDWAFHLRFKWDGRPIHAKAPHQCLLSAGLVDEGSGEMRGFALRIQQAGKFVCQIGKTAFMSETKNVTQIASNLWTDVVFSFSSQGGIDVYVQQEGVDLVRKSVSCANTNYRPDADSTFLIGNRYTRDGWAIPNSVYVQEAFRGQVNQFAIWNRSLTEDDVLRVLSWPNEDLVRAGLVDGSSDEFGGGGSLSMLIAAGVPLAGIS